MNVAILWLINEKGEILFSKRAPHMSTDANMWSASVSGKVDEGETSEQAAIREATEELGIDPMEIIPIHFLHYGRHNHSDGNLREYTFFCSNIASERIKSMRLESREVAAVRWISLNDLKKEYIEKPDTIIVSSNQELWEDIFENLEPTIKAVLTS
jgi:mutator protein MutT